MSKSVIAVKSDGRNAAKGDLFESNSTSAALQSTHTSELVIALCGPIGSPLHSVASEIAELLISHFSYEKCPIIRLSSFITAYAEKIKTPIPQSGADRINSLITVGDNMRSQLGASILAEFAIHDIRVDREKNGKEDRGEGNVRYVSRRVCHIIDSIKNQSELDLLRTVYRESLYVVGVFSPIEARVRSLKDKSLTDGEIANLIDRDSGEELANGQTVSDTFPHCDFFLRTDSGTQVQIGARVKRFIDLIMGLKTITPTRAEMAMYAAASAAGSSACLSRQVGAAVTDSEGNVLSVGWNDVPRAGGGLYYSDLSGDPAGENDKRCWNLGKCYNDEEKSLLATSIIEALGDVILDSRREEAVRRVAGNKKLRGLIEFSRSIHAEMHAILSSLAKSGDKVKGGKIFVTTYPCHSCARHIVAAGIMEVYYIEPYKKSLATKLHGDSISEVESESAKVRIIPFDGVAPSRFMSLYKMKGDDRKRNGIATKARPSEATPKAEKSLEALPALEAIVVESLRIRNLVDQ